MIYQHLGYSEGVKQEEASVSDENNGVIDWSKLNAEYEEEQKRRWAQCPELIKNFYVEHPEVSKMTEAEADAFRLENNNIVIKNFDEQSEAPIMKPCPQFYHAFEKYPDIMATINNQKFQRPSPIQVCHSGRVLKHLASTLSSFRPKVGLICWLAKI